MGASLRGVKSAAAVMLLMVISGCGHSYTPTIDSIAGATDPLKALVAMQESIASPARYIEDIPCTYVVTGDTLTRSCANQTPRTERFRNFPNPEIGGNDGLTWLTSPIVMMWHGYDVGNAAADQFANAWFVLARPRELDDPSRNAAFVAAVARYRSAPESHSERLRRVQVQVENALKEQRTAEAAMLYRDALDESAGWPEGHFNLALLYGDLEFYADAINAMRRYLYLVPDAPDARAAQDKIYEWERKL